MRVSRKAIEAMIAHGSQDAWFTDQIARSAYTKDLALV
jgi:hypothetical protein